MPTTTRTVYLTDENGNPLIDEQRNMRTLSFSLMQGYSYRLVERASIVSATYAQVVGYSTATGQTISGVENASEFDVGDFGIVQYAISDRNNTIGYVTCKVTAVGADSLTVNGIGISVAGADGADGKDGAPGADGKDGAATVQIGTVTTGAPGSQASVTNVGADNAAILNFTIPRGATGADGKDGTNGADGKDGVNGQDGAAATIQIGEVITGTPGTNASVENTGTENAAILKFTIPRGATGTPGADGQDGAPGAPGKDGATFTPSVDTNGDLSWSNDANLPNPETVNLRGAHGEAATVQVGQVTTLPAGSQATVTNSGTNQAAVLNFGIPTGATGANGITPHIGVDGFWYIGETNTNVKARGQDGEDGVTPHIGENGNWFIGNQDTNVKAEGTDGQDGAASTIEVGEVTTGAAGTQASVTNSGTANAAVLDFAIPKGADGASGVTDVTAGTPTEQDGYTVTPVTFNFERGNSKTVNIRAKNGEGGGAGVQQNAIINRTASVDTADENSPDFVENGGDLWVKKITGYLAEVDTLSEVMPRDLNDPSAVTAPNGKIYVFGWWNNSGVMFTDIVEFDSVAKSVTTLDVIFQADAVTAVAALNGKIYALGGYGNDGNAIVEFDSVAKSVTTLEVTLPSKRSCISAATAPNGKIYVFGGYSNIFLDEIVEFDPVTKTVTTLEATLPSVRRYTSAATALNGKIYVFGGQMAISGARYLDDIVEFDPVTRSVTTLEARLPSEIWGTSAVTAQNGKIYVFGAFGNDGTDIVEFDPATKTVTTLEATLPSAVRYNSSAATAPNGKIYIFGDKNTVGNSDIIEFDPPVTQYAYSPAVVLSQAEYTQLKNILQGIFAVGISAPSATVEGIVTASSFNATT